MKYGIIPLSIVPGRLEATSKSEQVTQLLFGEVFTVLEQAPKWLHIRSHHDHYECWIEADQAILISEEAFNAYTGSHPAMVLRPTTVTHQKSGDHYRLMPASLLYDYSAGSFKMGNVSFQVAEADVTHLPVARDPKTLMPLIKQFLTTPYLWGGRSPFGIDCSGFTQNVMRLCGISLPRDAYQQAEHGTTVEFAEAAQFGDLAFFDNDEGRITHVGIITEAGKIMHAVSRIKIDNLDHQGIFDLEKQKYTHKLRIIRRLF